MLKLKNVKSRNFGNKLVFVYFFLSLFALNSFSSFNTLKSQTFKVLDINSSLYPQISAKLFTLDDQLKPYKDIQKEDIFIKENGILRIVDSIVCNTEEIAVPPLSGVLTIDVSGSMATNNGLVIARTAASEWVNTKTPRPIGEEVAITAFADNSTIISDFSEDTQLLLGKIDSIRLEGGTNFDKAFLEEETGAFSLFKNALFNKRVIVFLTDGNGDGNADEIIAKAKELNVVVYCVSVNIFIPEVLKRVSTETGGRYFDNITTESEIRDVYRIIRKMAQNQSECKLYWQSGGCLLGREVELSIPKYGLNTTFNFTNPDSLLPRFRVLPNEFYVFDGIAPLSSGTRTVEIKAENSAISIDSIKTLNNLFKIISWQGPKPPLTLSKNQSLKFTVEFAPLDSTFSFATFIIYGGSCLGNEFYCIGGNPGVPPSNSSLRVLHPNGGEEILANSTSYINWDGTYSGANLKIDLSTNNGLSWSNIRDDYNQTSINDWLLPNIESDKCLVKVAQYSNDFGRKILNVDTYSNSVNDLDWSPDANLIAYASQDSSVRVISSINGKTILDLKKHNSPVENIVWSPDAVRFASAGSDSLIRIWNYFLQSQIDSIALNVSKINDIDWSSDGNMIAAALSDSTVRVFNTTNYRLIQSFNNLKAEVNAVEFSHNSEMLAFAGVDREVSIYNTKVWTNKVATFQGHIAPITSITWKGNDTQIASSSDSPEFIVKIWDLSQNKEIHSYSDLHQSSISSIDWNTKSNNIVSTGNDALVNIWNPNDGKSIYTFKDHSWPHVVAKWSGDGSRVASGFLGKNLESQMHLYSITKFPLLQGISARNFSIIKVELNTKSVVFEDTKLNIINDKNFNDVLVYNKKAEIRIDSIKIENDFDKVFKVVNTNFPILFDSNNLPQLVFQFKPTKVGIQKAKVVYYTSIGKKEAEIIGNGYQADIQLEEINFAQVNLNSIDNSNDKQAYLKLKNTSSRTIKIDSLMLINNSDIFQIVSNVNNLSIAPSSSDSVLIILKPLKIGKYQSISKVYYELDSNNNKVIGEVINPTLLFDSLISFNQIICEDSLITKVKLNNSGRGNIVITDLSIDGINKSDFSILNKTQITTNNPLIIKQNDSTELIISFNPKLIGIKQAEISMTSNAINSINNLKKIKLFGNKSSLDFTFNGGNNKIDFVDINDNEIKDLTFKIKNNGDLNLDLSSYTGLIINTKFQILSINPSNINPKQEADITIRFLGGDKGQVYTGQVKFKNICSDEIEISLNASVKSEDASLVYFNFKDNLDLKPCKITDTIKVEVFNNGKKTLNITDITSNNVNFAISNSKIDILPNETEIVNVIIDENFEGVQTLMLNFKSNSYDSDNQGNKSYNIEVRRFFTNYLISENEIILEFQGTNSPLPKEFIIYNISKSKLVLKQNSDISPIELTGNIELNGESSSKITISYSGVNNNQVINKDLILEDECGKITIIKLSVIPSNSVKLHLELGKLESNTNQEIEFPIILTKLENFKNSNVTEIELKFSFNKTLIYPSLSQNWQTNYSIQNGLGIVTQKYNLAEIIKNNSTNEVINLPINLPSLKLFTLWGNDSLTNINLESIVSSVTDTYPITYINNTGEVKLSDICRSGGTRLFIDSDDTLKLSANIKNDVLSIQYNLIEKSNATIILFNSLGQVFINEVVGYSNLGQHFKSFNINNLPSGAYFVRVKTETKDMFQKILKE